MDSLHNTYLWTGKPCKGLGYSLLLAYNTPEAQGAKLTSIQSHEEPWTVYSKCSPDTKRGAAGKARGLLRWREGSLPPATVDRRPRLARVSQGKEMGEVLDPDAYLVSLNRAALRKNAALAISALLEARERRVPPKSQGAKYMLPMVKFSANCSLNVVSLP